MCWIYALQSLHGQLVDFYSFDLSLKICNDEVFLSSSGNNGHILTPTFGKYNLWYKNNVVLMFLEARWVSPLTL